MVSYDADIKNCSKSFCYDMDQTVRVYRDAVKYLTNIVLLHFDEMNQAKVKVNYIERLIHTTKKNQAKYPLFDQRFVKFPSYLRRAAIRTAIGKVSGYCSQVANWKADGCKGKKPFMNFSQDMMPCFYRKDMFLEVDGEFFIKIYSQHDWVWKHIPVRRTDLEYIRKNCYGLKEHAPVLKKRRKGYALCFAYDIPQSDQGFVKDSDVTTAMGVDLGINTDAVCTILRKDGTVTGTRFIDHLVEKDRMYTTLGRIRKCQQAGNRKLPRLWAYVDNYNTAVAKDTARLIVEYAMANRVQVIVFENLRSMKGKKRSKKQMLFLWRKREIQERTRAMAERVGIRVAYICAWNTSRLAFDGSGRVTRGTKAGFKNNQLCKFQNGKIYNCDLSGSKNIGARYLIRAALKALPEKERLQAEAKVPELCKRTMQTLATLISLTAVMAAHESVSGNGDGCAARAEVTGCMGC